MLAFALTLLGGYVQQAAESYEPQGLFFYCHSVRPEGNLSPYAAYNRSTSREQLLPQEHYGLYITENVAKSSQRTPFAAWGILSPLLENGTANTLCLSPCAKLFSGTFSPPNAAYISWSVSGTRLGPDAPLYKSGGGTNSPRFRISLHAGRLCVTDSFSGAEKTTEILMNKELVASESEGFMLYFFGMNPSYKHDFVVSAYHNQALGVKQLALPMRSITNTTAAIFEHERKNFYQV